MERLGPRPKNQNNLWLVLKIAILCFLVLSPTLQKKIL
jgi:hypothetical protein